MTAQPQWSPLDDTTADLLTLVRDEGHPSADHEWDAFVAILRESARLHAGLIDPNRVREQLRGSIAPRRIGAFYSAAARMGWLTRDGYSFSTDTTGKNAGRPVRTYLWTADDLGDIA